jgi:hypothetical protein
MEQLTAAERYKKVLAEAELIKSAAVDELTAAINSQIQELNSFGFSYALTDTSISTEAPAKHPGRPAGVNKDGSPRKQMSEEARAKIAAAQKKRWAKPSEQGTSETGIVTGNVVSAADFDKASEPPAPSGTPPEDAPKKRGRPAKSKAA